MSQLSSAPTRRHAYTQGLLHMAYDTCVYIPRVVPASYGLTSDRTGSAGSTDSAISFCPMHLHAYTGISQLRGTDYHSCGTARNNITEKVMAVRHRVALRKVTTRRQDQGYIELHKYN